MSTLNIQTFAGVKKIRRKPQEKLNVLDLGDNLKRQVKRQQNEALKHLENQDLDNLKITGISFCTFDKESLEKLSIADISNRIKTTTNSNQSIEIINDPRFGVMNKGEICSTCRNNLNICPGHLGRIKLYEPMINPIYIRTVVKILRCVCNTCCELIMTKEQIISTGISRYSGLDRLSAMEEISKNNRCTHRRDDNNVLKCKANPVYDTGKITETLKISVIYQDSTVKKKDKKEIPTEMPIKKIIEILDCISDETAKAMGFNNGSHPRNFIFHDIPLISPCIRPNEVKKGKISPSPITLKYNEIAKINSQIRNVSEKILKSDSNNLDNIHLQEELEKLRKLMYQKVLSLMEEKGASQTTGKAVEDLRNLIKGKGGYVRQNLLGKRVDFCGRTVISPDPMIEFGQLRIPKSISMILTVKSIVNSINREEIINLWNEGNITTIIQREGRNKNKVQSYSDVKNEVIPQIGDRIERFLQDGDYILFNRQPSLHKYSIQGYQVILGKDDTFGMHLSSTTPHNADFDGDEGSIHVLQDIGAITEATTLASVTNCLISAQNFRPSSGLVVDATTGSYILTQDNIYVSEVLFFDILSNLRNKDDIRTLETRFKKYNITYSVETNKDELIKQEELKLKRKLTKAEEDELIVKNSGISLLKLKQNLTKKEIEKVIPETLRLVPSLEQYVSNKLNEGMLNFIKNTKLKSDLEDFLLKSVKQNTIDLNDFDLPTELKDRISKLYIQVLENYNVDWVEQKIPSFKILLNYLKLNDPSIDIKDLSTKYYSLYTKTSYSPKSYSGRALYSALFPATFSYKKGGVWITEGVLRQGYISKDTVGTSQGSIIQAIAKDYGNKRAVEFITDASYLAVKYITEHGFSIGIKDCFPEHPSYKKFLRDKIQETIKKVKELEVEKQNTNNTIEKDIIESKISATVNVVKSIGNFLITEKLSTSNPFYVMSKSGAKGSESNYAQVSGIIAQQFTGNKRIDTKLTGGTRCLPYFKSNDIDPQARGFCTSSYAGGLAPHEVYFLQTGSRLGTMETNVSTKQSGKARRMIASSVSNMKVEYDGTVRNSNGRIFQIIYGEDQFDSSKLELFRNGKENVVLFFNPFRLADRLNSKVWIE